MVESGRGDAALALPERALAQQQPLAEKRAQNVPLEVALAVVAVIGEQYVLDIVRLVDQEAVQEQQALMKEISAEDLRHQDRKLVLAQAPDELDRTELSRDPGVLGDGGRRRNRLIHHRLLRSTWMAA